MRPYPPALDAEQQVAPGSLPFFAVGSQDPAAQVRRGHQPHGGALRLRSAPDQPGAGPRRAGRPVVSITADLPIAPASFRWAGALLRFAAGRPMAPAPTSRSAASPVVLCSNNETGSCRCARSAGFWSACAAKRRAMKLRLPSDASSIGDGITLLTSPLPGRPDTTHRGAGCDCRYVCA